MKSIFIVIAILFLVLVMLKCKAVEYMDDYEEGFAGSSKSVIICKADWCGHCKQAAPEFDKLLAASPMTLKDGTKVTVKVLDADHNKDEISQYKVRAYPTILIGDGANMTEYPGPRTYEGVFQFLNGTESVEPFLTAAQQKAAANAALKKQYQNELATLQARLQNANSAIYQAKQQITASESWIPNCLSPIYMQTPTCINNPTKLKNAYASLLAANNEIDSITKSNRINLLQSYINGL